MNSFYLLDACLAYYAIFLAVYGTLGNVITLVVCNYGKLRRRPTFVFLSFKVLADFLPLYSWNLNSYMNYKFGYNTTELNKWACQITTLLTGSAMESSSFLMVIYYSLCFILFIQHFTCLCSIYEQFISSL